ncbi:CHAD domain-containing protein [Ktedonospora formicarum]|uniref:CHAD domain-containing protein n=1 Tax=Ktedonospora formicarum TaxID=2778364 RepID=A0A8J3HY64_9CHLR|nr:CHAD domain-containing protein [Ktedonospora formicarum]GHO43275.1 hypothetical protein KSX_14380 [Ktedonospora formicarum]
MAKAKAIKDLSPQAMTVESVRKIVTTRLQELYDWADYVGDTYHARELHDMRIAAKRLRYTLELFADALPPECGLLVKEVELIQGELGELHDADVMVALLRLCLGSSDSGAPYQEALVRATKLPKKGKVMVDPDLVAHFADPGVTPSAEERQGLEWLLSDYEKRRKQHYTAFCQHWQELLAQDFRHKLLYAL